MVTRGLEDKDVHFNGIKFIVSCSMFSASTLFLLVQSERRNQFPFMKILKSILSKLNLGDVFFFFLILLAYW